MDVVHILCPIEPFRVLVNKYIPHIQCISWFFLITFLDQVNHGINLVDSDLKLFRFGSINDTLVNLARQMFPLGL